MCIFGVAKLKISNDGRKNLGLNFSCDLIEKAAPVRDAAFVKSNYNLIKLISQIATNLSCKVADAGGQG